MSRFVFFFSVLGFCLTLHGAEPIKVKLTHPLSYQVIQREGFQPKQSSANAVGGPELGYADVVIRAPKVEGISGTWQFKLVLLDKGYGRSFDWNSIHIEDDEKELRGLAEVPAGGWYRLDVRCVEEDVVKAVGSVEPIGVGEVFIVAGQSYAGGYNDEVLKVTDPSQAVSTYDWQAKTWKVAHDPPPHNGEGGSIWPPLGDLLVPTLRCPVAFVNVSVGATSTTKWLPNGPLHKRLISVGNEIGSFRAVLWQQGESDVIENTALQTYVSNMREIRDAAGDAWGFNTPWLLAKSTLHPTVYNRPIDEERIRKAIDQLRENPGFRPGPDTDTLGGENRGNAESRRHFSAIGQKRAALLWFVALWNELNRNSEE